MLLDFADVLQVTFQLAYLLNKVALDSMFVVGQINFTCPLEILGDKIPLSKSKIVCGVLFRNLTSQFHF